MPRYGVTIKLPGGGFSRICGPKPMRACECQYEIGAYLCDFPLDPNVPGETCDRSIGENCRTNVGPNLDYCPAHKDQRPTERLL